LLSLIVNCESEFDIWLLDQFLLDEEFQLKEYMLI
jgi:hypothetical protein